MESLFGLVDCRDFVQSARLAARDQLNIPNSRITHSRRYFAAF